MSEPYPSGATESEGGVRERKRRDTRQRVAEAGLRLFLARGYQGTTVEAIAAEAGISRRTFFAYFKSKDDILASWQDASFADIYADLLKTPPDVQPLDAVRDLLVKYTSRYTSEEMTVIDRLMRSSESLVARKQAFYAAQEQVLFSTLCQVWRQPERRMALRMVALVSIGAIKLATHAWNEPEGPRRPMARVLREAFESLRSEL